MYINVYKCTTFQNVPKLTLEIDEVASLSKGEPHLEKSTGHPLSDLLVWFPVRIPIKDRIDTFVFSMYDNIYI